MRPSAPRTTARPRRDGKTDRRGARQPGQRAAGARRPSSTTWRRRTRRPRSAIAVFYTPAVREEWGGEAAIRSQAEVLVEETNGFYMASGVRQRLTLVAAEEVAGYVEAAEGFGTDLRRLTEPMDGHMDEVA